MNLAFSSLGCTEWDIEKIAVKAVEYGYQAVELRGHGGEHVDVNLSRSERREVREVFRRNGLAVLGVTTYTRFAKAEQAERRAAEEELAANAELAHDIGSHFVRAFIGEPPDAADWPELAELVAQSLERVCRAVEGLQVTVLVETHDHTAPTARLEPVLKRVLHPGLGVLWDCAHSCRAGEAPEDSLAIVSGRIGYLHLKDEYMGADGSLVRCLPGRGVVPLRAIRDLLIRNGYHGFFCLEWERKWHPEMLPLEQALPEFKKLMELGL